MRKIEHCLKLKIFRCFKISNIHKHSHTLSFADHFGDKIYISGEGIMEYNHTVYTILHPQFSLEKAGVVEGMNVLNFASDRLLARDNADIHKE